MSETDFCPDCRIRKGMGHHYQCSHATPAEQRQWLERRIAYLEEDNRHLREMACRRRRDMELWHGKYFIVKHENNKLRQRLWRQTREEKDEPQVPPAGL